MTASDAGSAVLAPATYRIDPATTTITFTTKHMFGLGSVKGSLAVSDGHVAVAERTEDSSVEVTLDVASFATDNPKRDDKVRSATLLDAASHPTMSYRAGAAERRGSSWVLHGQLTVRGTTAPVDLVVRDVVATPEGLTATATGRVDRTLVGVTAMKGMVGRYLDVSIEVTATV